MPFDTPELTTMAIVFPYRSVIGFQKANLKAALSEGTCDDWRLQNYDQDATYAPDVERECELLLVLQDYHILDSEVEPEFEETTEAAKEIFNVPIAVVSLVDFGRQWFKSIHGLEAKEIHDVFRSVLMS